MAFVAPRKDVMGNRYLESVAVEGNDS